MKRLDDEGGMVMVVALGLIIALAAMSLAIARSGQMSTLSGALSAQATNAFYLADGAAYHALGDETLFDPEGGAQVKDLSGGATAMQSMASVTFRIYRSLPGNLLIRTTDGRMRPAQFGQNEGLGRMFFFDVDGVKTAANAGIDPRSSVQMQAARPGPCADCAS
jgi:hypothetical protein